MLLYEYPYFTPDCTFQEAQRILQEGKQVLYHYQDSTFVPGGQS